MITGTIMQSVPVNHLDRALLDGDGRMRALFPAETFLGFEPDHLKLWCHLRARYGLPTLELVQWLRDKIGGRDALEIGAGNGDLGYLAGIRETDSYVQQTPELRAYFRITGQPSTCPARTVVKLDALAAIKKYRPRVVVASWFTRKFEIGKDVEGRAQASIYGVREEEILANAETYIHIGHEAQHGGKTLLALPHKAIRFPGLLSRSAQQDGNVIYVWENTAS
jgi:hypothetical protein